MSTARRREVVSSTLAIQGEQAADFIVLQLLETLIPLSDRGQRRRNVEDDNCVGLAGDQVLGFCRGNWRGGHDLGGACVARSTNRGKHRAARRQTIIDQYGRLEVQIERTETASVYTLAPSELGALGPGGFIEHIRQSRAGCWKVGLVYDDVARSDCADGELRLTGHSDLAYRHDIQRGVQAARDLIGDRHATSSQPEHDDGMFERSQFQLSPQGDPCCGATYESA